MPSDPPPRLVRRDLLGPPHLAEDELVIRLQSRRGPEVDLGTGAAGQVDATQGVGADLAGGRAQGVGRLQRVAALGPPAARRAVPDVDAELAEEGRAGDLGL